MKEFMVEAIIKNLERGVKLLTSISDEQFSDNSIPPYYSSIGCNMRHVLDAFTSIFNGLETGVIDFTDRNRNTICEENTEAGVEYFKLTIAKLNKINVVALDEIIPVKDDLGFGLIEINYTLESALAYAHSHAIHHFASIGFLIYQLNIQLSDTDFGYNPTTPKICKHKN